eukprot:CAMPEP_0117017384 /NCGR_PEP_ID=MMETSP0472-20121206/13578_1 /TAXON_ID=693140 ORGANISM="Tiarina fusus, Strain LIS" /NCGR_SAMPLE_ID=MMETSP0472 /ASSEMBLY_ACC=CAM_ASM_000603 /LENGTH=211 /DNA_ID=CAMNT_0004721727 /DNA_START=56 /DNA_END=691 /DNA_ORIENTATION=+
MAAVICSTIGELCSAAGRVACLPCRACGLGCDALGDVIKSPFMPYILVTFGLNMPPVFYGVKSYMLDCSELSTWMFSNAFLALAHMIACMYVVGKIREPKTNGTTPDNSNNVEEGTYYKNFSVPQQNEHGAANSCGRIKHVMCYDKKMAVYILVAICWVVWQAVGVGKRFGYAEGNNCDEVSGYMGIVIGCGYMYMCMVGLAFACSLCCLR